MHDLKLFSRNAVTLSYVAIYHQYNAVDNKLSILIGGSHNIGSSIVDDIYSSSHTSHEVLSHHNS